MALKAEKCRSWRVPAEKNQAEKERKTPFFNAWGRQTSKKCRGWPVNPAKSLSVEQFLCAASSFYSSLSLNNYSKKGNRPYKTERRPCTLINWSIFAPRWFLLICPKARACKSMKISDIALKRHVFEPLTFCTPPPPEKKAGQPCGVFANPVMLGTL